MLPTENPWPAIVVLVCVAIVFLAQWSSKGKRANLILAAICLLFGVGCYFLDVFVHTPSEVITENIYGLATAFQKHEAQKTLSYFSNRCRELPAVQSALKDVHVGDDLRITDVSVSFKAANSIAISHFRANASVRLELSFFTGDVGYQPSRWELEWEREAGQWKVMKVRRLNPLTGKEIHFMATSQ
jgi:hypothetical protein